MVQYLIFVYNRGEHGFPYIGGVRGEHGFPYIGGVRGEHGFPYIGGVRGEHGFPCYFPSVLYTGALDLASSADRCAFF
jgi:hypothetical protein